MAKKVYKEKVEGEALPSNWIFSEIWNEWSPYLSPFEFKVIMFIFYRTIIFNKTSESIAIRHFCEGVFDRNGIPVIEPVGMSPRTIKRTLSALEAYGIIIRKVTPGRWTEYSFNFSTTDNDLLSNKVKYIEGMGKIPTFVLKLPVGREPNGTSQANSMA